jgi:2,5-dihydroxypyridine 5,6-dioxygenase
MNTLLENTDLVHEFEEVFKLCKLQPNEKVLIFTDVRFPYSYYSAALGAAHSLGAITYLLVAQSNMNLEDKLIEAAWLNSDFIIGMSFLPGNHSWMYTDLNNAALSTGARVLMVQEPLDVLLRMRPIEAIRRRGLAGAQRMEKATKVRLTSPWGTDLTFRKDGRKGSYQCGITDSPGRWDHWPTGMVYCAPCEETAEGVLMVRPGDILLGSLRFANSEVRIYFENGKAINFEGGPDAQQTHDYLKLAGDDDSFRLAHAGWGTDHRADWRYIGMDSESFYGNITIALGRNIFNAPAPHCGLGGINRSKTHFDLCLRSTSLYLDEELIIDKGNFVVEDLI